ncbi:MFS transporter [Candidimonas sp. SYP-B2681]|nr:MFS transporter [Candidimonas sp. SYP-B2681]
MLLGASWFFCLLSGYYLLRPLRDALGLLSGTGELQWLFTATFLVMLAIVPLFGTLVSRLSPRQFVPLAYRFFIVTILIFSALLGTDVKTAWTARIFFVWISVFNLFVVSVFWSVLADCFSNAQGRRLFGFIAAGGTAGGLIGPAIAASVVTTLGPVVLTLCAALLLEVALQCFHGLYPKPGQTIATIEGEIEDVTARGNSTPIGGGVLGGLLLIVQSPYLLGICAYLLLHSAASTFLYFEQGRIVTETFQDTAERARFFAMVDFGVSVFTLGVQLFATGRLMPRFGVGVALIVLPFITAMSFGMVAIWPTVGVLAIAQIARRTLDYSIARPAREVLFTVLDREKKYKAKNAIDTVVYRGGDAVSGWISSALTALGIGFAGITLLCIPLIGLWAALSLWLSRNQERQHKFSQEETSTVKI